VRNSIQEAKDKVSEGVFIEFHPSSLRLTISFIAEEAFLFVPCPLTLVMKTMSQSAAKNFQALFDYVYDDSRLVAFSFPCEHCCIFVFSVLTSQTASPSC
jgi:hypothetical protein